MYNFGKFRVWCQKVLPLVYDDSLSYYEVLCKLLGYLEHVMQDLDTMSTELADLQKLYAELKKQVDDYLSDDKLAEVINARLDEMAADGTLDEIIGEATERFLANKVLEYAKSAGGFTAQRVFRVPFDWDKAALQSIAYDAGNHVFYLAGNHSNEDDSFLYAVGASGVILEGSPVTLSYADVGHMNSITYMNQHLYVAPSTDDYGQIRIVELSVSGFNVTKTFNISQLMENQNIIVSADQLANVPGVCAYDNGHLLIMAHFVGNYRSCYFYELDPETSTLTDRGHYNLAAPAVGSFHYQLFRQSLECINDTVYVTAHNPASIIKYHLGDPETLFSVVEIGDGNGFYPYGELEDLVALPDGLYMYTGVYFDDDHANLGFGNVWKTNLFGPGTACIKTHPSCIDNETLYVDPTHTSLNPEGTNENPFPTLEEASTVINYVNKHANPTFLQLYLKTNSGNDDPLLLQNISIRVNTPLDAAIPVLIANDAQVAVRYATIGELISFSSDLNLSSCAVTKLDASDSKIYMSHTSCGQYSLNRTLLTLSRPWDAWYSATVTNAVQSKITGIPPLNQVEDSHAMSQEGVVFVLTGFWEGYLEHSTETNDTVFSVVWRDGEQGNHPETTFNFRLLTADLASLREGTPVNRYASQVVKAGQGSAVLTMKAEVEGDKITFLVDEVEWIGDGSGTPAGALYDLRIDL